MIIVNGKVMDMYSYQEMIKINSSYGLPKHTKEKYSVKPFPKSSFMKVSQYKQIL